MRKMMRQWTWLTLGALAAVMAGATRAELPTYKLSLLPEDESV